MDKYSEFIKKNEVPSRYNLTCSEVVEVLNKTKKGNSDEILEVIEYIYALGFKKGRNYEKNKRKKVG